MTTPEQRARKTIDQRLNTAGWHIQDYADLNLSAARGIAVREFPLKIGFADYLLFAETNWCPIPSWCAGAPRPGSRPSRPAVARSRRSSAGGWGIAEHTGVNLSIAAEDLDIGESYGTGGRIAAKPALLDELNVALGG